MKDIKKFKNNFTRLTNMFDQKKLTVFFVNEYFEALKKWSDDVVESAIDIAIKNWVPGFGRTFPAPSELVEFARRVRLNQIHNENIFHVKKEKDLGVGTEKSRKMLNLLKKFGQKKIDIKELRTEIEKIVKERDD